MSDVLNELNNFLAKSAKGKTDEMEIKNMIELREKLMQDKILAMHIDTFIKDRPQELELSEEQMEHITWVFITYLISTGVIKLIIKH